MTDHTLTEYQRSVIADIHDKETAALRDEFAMQALQGMLHKGFVPRQFLDDKPAEGLPPPRDYAAIAYRIADAMLAARAGAR